MKILPELVPLVKEHQQSLSLANRAIKVAESKVEADILALCTEIQETFWDSFQAHFHTEEETILVPLLRQDESLQLLCTQLMEEHKLLTEAAEELLEYPESLEEFGRLLKAHTRTEDREVFPLVEKKLTTRQKQTIFRKSKI